MGAADVPALTRACQDPEIPRWTRVPRPYTPEDARAFVAAAAAEAAAGIGVALVVADAGDVLLGTIGLDGDRPQHGQRGARLLARPRGARARRRHPRGAPRGGLGRATSSACAGWRSSRTRGNASSARVAERAGFAATGETRRLARMPPGKRDGYRVHVWTPPPAP